VQQRMNPAALRNGIVIIINFRLITRVACTSAAVNAAASCGATPDF
jgi:hypothetical protein